MTVDLAVAILVVAGFAWGLWRGMIRQTAALVGWACAAVAVWFGAPALARIIDPYVGGTYSARWAFSAIVLGIVAKLAGHMLFSLLAKGFLDRFFSRRTDDGSREPGRTRREIWDRFFGSLLGAAKATVLIWVVLSCAAILVAGLREFGVQPTVKNARTYEFAQEHNAVLLLFSPRVEKLFLAIRELPVAGGEGDGAIDPSPGEPGDGKRRPASPALERLADDPKVAKVVREPGVLESLRRGDLASLVDYDAVRDLLSQPGALERLGEALDEAWEAAGNMKSALRLESSS